MGSAPRCRSGSPDFRQKHDIDTDLLRIISALGVVTIHLSELNTFSGIFMNGVARFSVPVFVIISGYYMLAQKTDGKRLAQKCGKLLLQMLFWSGIYYGYNLLRGASDFTGIGSMLTYLFTKPIHLWYLYAIIALYLFTPALFVFAEHASRREYLYALALTFFLGSPIVILLRSGWFPILAVILEKMQVPYLLGMVFLYLLGGYLRKYGVERAAHWGILYLLGIIGTVITVAGTALLQAAGRSDNLLMSFFAPNVIAESVMVFVFCKRFLYSHPVKSEKLSAAVRIAAKNTFGIYLVHPLVISLTKNIPMPNSTALTIVFRVLLVFAVSMVITAVLRAIPVLKRLVV